MRRPYDRNPRRRRQREMGPQRAVSSARVDALYSYGYGNDTLTRFLSVIAAHAITGVLDIRDDELLAVREEYAPHRLAEVLGRLGIAYARAPILAIPDPLLYRPRSNGHGARFLAQYLAYLDSLDPAGLAPLCELVGEGTWLLLCTEEDPAICHRREAGAYVARLLARDPADVVELRAPPRAKES